MRSVWFVLLACSSPRFLDSPSPCEQAWERQRDAVLELHEAAGKPPPPLPDDADAVRACEALNLSPEQVACLDPIHTRGHPALCAKILPETERAPWNEWLLKHVAGVSEPY